MPPPPDNAPPVPTFKRNPPPCTSITPLLVRLTMLADTVTLLVLAPLLPRMGATAEVVRRVPLTLLLNVTDCVFAFPIALTSPRVTAPVISNSPLLVMLPAPSTSILPALQVTLPSLLRLAPLFQLFSPPLIFKAPPVVTTSAEPRLPKPQLAVPRTVVIPVRPKLPLV